MEKDDTTIMAVTERMHWHLATSAEFDIYTDH